MSDIIDALIAAPLDAAVWGVYGDWLEERQEEWRDTAHALPAFIETPTINSHLALMKTLPGWRPNCGTICSLHEQYPWLIEAFARSIPHRDLIWGKLVDKENAHLREFAQENFRNSIHSIRMYHQSVNFEFTEHSVRLAFGFLHDIVSTISCNPPYKLTSPSMIEFGPAFSWGFCQEHKKAVAQSISDLKIFPASVILEASA